MTSNPVLDARAESTSTGDRIVAGYDGSAGSAMAVDWAAGEAVARGSTLRMVMCWPPPPEVDYYYVGARQSESVRSILHTIRERYPSLVVETVEKNDDPRDAVIEEARHADLLVLGSSESGAAKALLFGSVARTVARRSPCPLVVVRGEPRRPVRRIVVAVDGSTASNAALDWVAEEAPHHGAEIVVIHARAAGAVAQAQSIVDAAVDRCRQQTTADVRGQVVAGEPDDALIEASEGADLIAIGSRGRSGFKTMLFGSVALSTVEHSACPVLVTHPHFIKH